MGKRSYPLPAMVVYRPSNDVEVNQVLKRSTKSALIRKDLREASAEALFDARNAHVRLWPGCVAGCLADAFIVV